MNSACTTRKPLILSDKVPDSSRAFVQRLSEKLLGETALHKNSLSHEDPARIKRMLEIFKGYEHFAKYRQPPEAKNPKDFRKIDWRARKFVEEIVIPEFAKDPMVEIVKTVDLSRQNLCVNSEFGKLNTVLVAFPHNLDWGAPINAKEAAMQENRPNRIDAVLQHANFVDMLLASGAKVIISYTESKQDLMDDVDSTGHHIRRPIRPEEVYTRDVLQVAGGVSLRGNMTAPVRVPETAVILNAHGTPKSGNLEFGDFFVVKPGRVLVTTGDRTQEAAIHEAVGIMNMTSKDKWSVEILHKITQVPEQEFSFLHGDCVFGAIPGSTPGVFEGAYWFPPAFVDQAATKAVIEGNYGKIIGEIADGTRQALGANLLWLDERTAILNEAAEEMGKILEGFGKTVLRLNLGEIARGDGSGRCSSAPMHRND